MTALSFSALLPAALPWAVQTSAITFPATVEVDLIFPRNETYAPTEIFPIVFAFQNPALAPSLDPGFDLNVRNVSAMPDVVSDDPTLDVAWTNFSGTDPVYVYIYVTSLNTTYGLPETRQMLVWSFGARNCSNATGSPEDGGGYRTKHIDFTIRSGAQQPDLVAATTNSSLCTDAPHFAFNLTGTLDLPADNRNTCAVFSDAQPEPLASGNPCAVRVSPEAASSIMAAMTDKYCGSSGNTPGAGCSSSNAAGLRGWDTWNTVVLGGFVAASVAVSM